MSIELRITGKEQKFHVFCHQMPFPRFQGERIAMEQVTEAYELPAWFQ
jgi:hypothetical protein